MNLENFPTSNSDPLILILDKMSSSHQIKFQSFGPGSRDVLHEDRQFWQLDPSCVLLFCGYDDQKIWSHGSSSHLNSELCGADGNITQPNL
jgi:hypothetical protein